MRSGSRLFLAVALPAALLFSAAQARAASDVGLDAVSAPSNKTWVEEGPSDRFMLDGEWFFRKDPGNKGLTSHWFSDIPIKGWTGVTAPNAYNATDESEESFKGYGGWYLKRFTTPRSIKDLENWALRFQSVADKANVWLNGRYLGEHRGPFIAFELPVSKLKAPLRRSASPPKLESGAYAIPAARKDGVNELVIRVDPYIGLEGIPLSDYMGWWHYLGLLREVYLRKVPSLDATGVDVRPTLDCRSCPGKISVSVDVRNREATPRGGVAGTVSGPNGFRRRLSFKPATSTTAKSSAGEELEIPGRTTTRFTSDIAVAKPALWEPGSPNLYSVKITLGPDSGDPYQTYKAKTGIRSFKKLPDGTLTLNDLPLQLRGASFHEDSLDHGAALTQDQRNQLFGLLRSLRANITRAHYPVHPRFYELADKYGIVMYNQTPVYQTPSGLLGKDGYRQEALDYIRDNIAQNRNHPSIMVWSVSNELAVRPGPPEEAYFRAASTLVRELDPTRFVAADTFSNAGSHPFEIYKIFDVLGVNEYFGWYFGPDNSTPDRYQLSSYIDRVDSFYPGVAKIITEFGSEASRTGAADEPGTYEFQTDLTRFNFDTFATKPYLSGAIYWLLREFRAGPRWTGGNPKPSPPWHHKAVFDKYGAPKPAADLLRGVFSNTPWHR